MGEAAGLGTGLRRGGEAGWLANVAKPVWMGVARVGDGEIVMGWIGGVEVVLVEGCELAWG